MAGQSRGFKTLLGVPAPNPRGKILGRCEKETRVAGPFDILNGIKVTAEIAVQDERSEFDLPVGVHTGSWRGMP